VRRSPGFTAGAFLEALTGTDVGLLLELRQRLGVRAPDYSWANTVRLQRALAAANVGYRHVKGLAPTTELRHIQYRAGDCALSMARRSRTSARGDMGSPTQPKRRIGCFAAAPPVRSALCEGLGSAVEHPPADVVAQPLVIEDELANRVRELVALPLAFHSPRRLTFAVRRGSAYGFDRVGGRTELMRGDVGDGPGLASGVRGMSCCSAQVPGCTHGVAAGRASRHHRDLAPRPGARLLDRLTGPWVVGSNGLEE
jgi:hypothetical protein